MEEARTKAENVEKRNFIIVGDKPLLSETVLFIRRLRTPLGRITFRYPETRKSRKFDLWSILTLNAPGSLFSDKFISSNLTWAGTWGFKTIDQ